MDCQLTEIDGFTRRLNIAVPWVELEDKYNTFLQKFSKRIRIPGFRKGKVPLRLVRQQFGPMAEEEFAENAVQEYYLAALDEQELEPINQAAIRNVHFREGEDLRFEATFEVEPEVVLPTYEKGMKFEQVIYDAEAADVDLALKDLQQQNAEMRTLESGGAESLHFLVVDLQEVDSGGTPLIGRKTENQYLHLDPEGPLGSANVERLMGARVGDTRRIEIVGESGSSTYYEVMVKQISERMLPDLNDDFARQVDPETEDLEQLRTRIMERIQSTFRRESEKQLTNQIADYFVRNANLDIPPSLFDNYLDALIADLEREGRASEEIDREQVREQHKASIIWNLKWYLLRKQLIDVEGIQVDDDGIEQRIAELAAQNPSKAGQIRALYRRSENRRNLKEDMISEALYERLREYAKIKVTHKPSRELREAS